MTTSKISRFTILLANGSAIDQTTVINRKGVRIVLDTPEAICKLIKSDWCKLTGSKSFTDWANSLNESGEYEGAFTKEDALGNLSSNYTLNIDGKHVNLFDFFKAHLPFKVS